MLATQDSNVYGGLQPTHPSDSEIQNKTNQVLDDLTEARSPAENTI